MLQTRAVEFAKKFNVKIHVRNSQNDQRRDDGSWPKTPHMEHITVIGHRVEKRFGAGDASRSQSPTTPVWRQRFSATIAGANIMVDDIIQNVFDDNTANISFTDRAAANSRRSGRSWTNCAREFGGQNGTRSTSPICRKVSVVGVGMRTHTGVAQRMFKALAEAQINIQNITTSEIRISCIIASGDGPRALRLVHDAFDLGDGPAVG